MGSVPGYAAAFSSSSPFFAFSFPCHLHGVFVSCASSLQLHLVIQLQLPLYEELLRFLFSLFSSFSSF